MSLKLLLDENIPISVFKSLKERRYEVFYVPKAPRIEMLQNLPEGTKQCCLQKL